MTCVAEPWCSNDLPTNNLYQLPNYVSIHQVRKNGKTGSGITIFIQKDLIYNTRDDLSVSNDDTEALCFKTTNHKSKK